MKRLKSIETEEYSLEVIECNCDFHIGLDATYLATVNDVVIECPSCKSKIDTSVLLPEYF